MEGLSLGVSGLARRPSWLQLVHRVAPETRDAPGFAPRGGLARDAGAGGATTAVGCRRNDGREGRDVKGRKIS
jgi:hypothetical protein